MTPTRYFQTVRFKTYADLQAERRRTYLGLLWWFAEPLMMMGVFYVIFGLGLRSGGPDFLPVLMVGLVLWQWFRGTISHTTNSIHQNRALVRDVLLPVSLFPVVTLCTDAVKFSLVLMTLLVVLWLWGYTPTWTYLAFPLVLLAQLLLVLGISLVVSAVVPFLPDLRFLIDPLLLAVFFVSCVFHPISSLSPDVQPWIRLNPVAGLIDAARDVLLRGVWPDFAYLGVVAALGLLGTAAGVLLMRRLAHRYPKLPS
jgi:lipopolysaccharide transport system permease protein